MVLSIVLTLNGLRVFDRFRFELADAPLADIKVALDAETQGATVGLQLIQAEIAPFVVVVAEYAHISEEHPALRVVFGRIPRAGTDGIEEFGHHNRVGHLLLAAHLGEPFDELLIQEFHGLEG